MRKTGCMSQFSNMFTELCKGPFFILMLPNMLPFQFRKTKQKTPHESLSTWKIKKGFIWTHCKVKAEKILCFQQGKVDGWPKRNLIIISRQFVVSYFQPEGGIPINFK